MYQAVEDRPTGFRTSARVPTGPTRATPGDAWRDIVAAQRLFHDQLRANGEGGTGTTLRHHIVDLDTGRDIATTDYRAGIATGAYQPEPSPWSTQD